MSSDYRVSTPYNYKHDFWCGKPVWTSSINNNCTEREEQGDLLYQEVRRHDQKIITDGISCEKHLEISSKSKRHNSLIFLNQQFDFSVFKKICITVRERRQRRFEKCVRA